MNFIDYIKLPFYWLSKILYQIFFCVHWLLDKSGIGICWFTSNVVLYILSCLLRFIGRSILWIFEKIRNLFYFLYNKLSVETDDNLISGEYEK